MSEPSLAPSSHPSPLVWAIDFPCLSPPSCLTIAGRTVQLPPASTRYSLFAALSGLMGEGLALYLPQITTLMLLSLRSTEGIVVSSEWVGWAGWEGQPRGHISLLGPAEPESLLCFL